MTRIGLEERRKALEEAFFRKQDAELIARLRDREAVARAAEELGDACGLHDAEALEPLVRQGIGAATLPALLLAPVVAVAWANGRVSAAERLEVLDFARELGVVPQGPSDRLLRGWLAQAPDPELVEAWLRYARALARHLDPAQLDEVRGQLLRRAHAVSRASGGVLGVAGESSEEQAVLARLEEALTP